MAVSGIDQASSNLQDKLLHTVGGIVKCEVMPNHGTFKIAALRLHHVGLLRQALCRPYCMKRTSYT